MTHIVNDACLKCKYTECVVVCPVNAFKEGKDMLVIDPDICIDCGVCVPECPASAIQADTEAGTAPWVRFNRACSARWPEITAAKMPPKDADIWLGKCKRNLLPDIPEAEVLKGTQPKEKPEAD